MSDWKGQLQFDHQRMKDAAACVDCEVPWPCEAAQALSYIAELEAENSRLRTAIQPHIDEWFIEYRGCGYGNCAGCGCGVVDIRMDLRDASHEPDCMIMALAAALEARDG